MREIYFLLVFLFFLGCQKNKQEPLTIERSVFKDILKDLHELEGGYDSSLFIDSTITQEHLLIYDSLFATKGITKEDFLEEYHRYLSFYLPDIDSIYNEIIEDFTLVRDSIENLLNDEDNFIEVDDEDIEDSSQSSQSPIRDLKSIQRLPQTKDSGEQ